MLIKFLWGITLQKLNQNLQHSPLPYEIKYESLQELFASCAEIYAKQTALEFEDQKLTYAELKKLSNQFAHFLRANDVQAGDFVVLYMPRSLDMFIAMLGILEAGAVYVPMDPHAPIERVAYVYKDCQAKFIVTSTTLMKPDFTLASIYFDQIKDELKKIKAMSPLKSPVTKDSLAYVIYTSGSTGQPKGVMIRHSSIVHFIYSESSVLQLRPDDVVLQGFSLSFDMSLEEIWTAFFSGSKLVIASHELMSSGPDLAGALSKMGITVWHCVPTLLSMQQEDVPSVRLINLGGEACPSNLVERWSRKNRRLINTYGPTETTVTATYAELFPQKPVTIGKGLPGYQTYIVDEQLNLVEKGKEGELCISGPGLAAGYINRPDLTSEKFTKAPFIKSNEEAVYLYRTGDLVRLNDSDDIEFLGRFDTQVKIRGFRVELSEIESVLMQIQAIQTAVVALLKDKNGMDALVAFIILKEEKINEAQVWQHLRSKLPPYMIPAILEITEDLARLPSGKIDRKKLQFPEKAINTTKKLKKPSTPMEEKIHQVWSELFDPVPVSVDDDFFLDLGGHSLRVALMISKLRKIEGLSSVSIQDVYRNRNIINLANYLTEVESRDSSKESTRSSFRHVSKLTYISCVMAQSLSLFFIFGYMTLLWFVPFFSYFVAKSQGYSFPASLGISFGIALCLFPTSFMLSLLTKWLIIGKMKEGDYPLWGSYYFRWWLVRRVNALVPFSVFRGSSLLNLYFRLLGAKIGKNVFLNSGSCDAWDLLNIGSHSTISQGVNFSCSSVEGGYLKLRRVSIGENCFVGVNSILGMNTKMEEGSQLEDLSLLSNNASVPKNEIWSGSPAKKIETLKEIVTPQNSLSFTLTLLQLALVVFVLPIIGLFSVVPGLIYVFQNQNLSLQSYILHTPLLACSYLILTCLLIAGFKWILLGKVKEGQFPISSFHFIRFWFVNQLMDISLTYIRPIYATLYLAPWFRLLGVKLGKRAEVSTGAGIPWDLLSIADESFVADGVTLGVPRIKNGYVSMESTSIGERTFLGNSAYVPSGTQLSDNMLVGCLSTPPQQKEQRLESFTSWFGSPAIFLPQRQIFNQFDDKTTYYPSKKLYALRLFIEGVRNLLPFTLELIFGGCVIFIFYKLHMSSLGIGKILLSLPFFYLGYGLASVLTTVLIKKLLMGTYKPTVQPLWSHFVWRSELVTVLYENFPVPFFLNHLRGTPYINMCLRWMGAKIGKRVYTDTTDITEHDVVEIGDDAALNEDCGLQTHLFEERIMKVSKVSIGNRCTVGAYSIVLYDAVMEDDSQLGDLSMLMKGETLPAQTEWEGLPAQKV